MKRVVLMLALALVIPALAMASNFTYSTALTINNLSCSGGCSQGTVVLTTIDQASTQIGPNNGSLATIDLGFLDVTDVGGSAGGDPISGTFKLTIIQTAPDAGNGNYNGSLSGTFFSNGGSGTWLVLSSNVLTLGGSSGITTVYKLDNTQACVSNPGQLCVQISGPNSSGAAGVTHFQADVTQVPEPASIMLFGSGLTGLAGLVRRRNKK